MLSPVHLQEGLRIFLRAQKVRAKGFKRYKGNASEICSKIVSDCWNGRYFQVSRGNFPEFYTRDFGWCCESLLKLGYRKEVLSSLDYALGKFAAAGKITTAISQGGKPFDFPCYAPDSLAYLIRSLKLANAKELVEKHGEFLNREARRFFQTVIDANTGLVKADRCFSSMKDHAKRRSSCYDNVMAAMLKEDLSALRLENPLKSYNSKNALVENFWNGRFFRDDLGSEYVAGDANVIPFWTGVIKSQSMLRKAVSSLQEENLDMPFPLRYTNAKQDMILIEKLAKGYERDAVWTHMGPMFISIVRKINKRKSDAYMKTYEKVIEKHGNYLEVFTKKGAPFHSPFYYCDEGMLWAANYLAIK
ncbi:hypothetical protein JXB11_04160 [Candidatus Woesearchaeota archaeon]|nr:hypothetical protein [Candidatus Woesearchaeota archaeon]